MTEIESAHDRRFYPFGLRVRRRSTTELHSHLSCAQTKTALSRMEGRCYTANTPLKTVFVCAHDGVDCSSILLHRGLFYLAFAGLAGYFIIRIFVGFLRLFDLDLGFGFGFRAACILSGYW